MRPSDNEFITGVCMQNVAIVFASKNGQTRKIAHAMLDVLIRRGIPAQLHDLSQPKRPQVGAHVDGVILGGPVYMGRFPRRLERWVRDHHDRLRDTSTAFFSVSMNAADNRSEMRHADDELLEMFLEHTGWIPGYVASFAGAIKYRRYNWLVKRIMRNISKEAKGPTDTSMDYEFTDWEAVTRFTTDFVTQKADSPFATARRLPEERDLSRLMPEFEQHWVMDTVIDAPPERIYEAFQNLNPKSMRLADLLGKIRTLGQHEEAPATTFSEAAERFGNVSLVDEPNKEIVSGLVGQFWKRDFGIRRIKPEEFSTFSEPGYAKVLSAFRIDPVPGTKSSRVHSVMRVHATSDDAAKKFNRYWMLLNPGIKLYMRSMLAALRRQAVAAA